MAALLQRSERLCFAGASLGVDGKVSFPTKSTTTAQATCAASSTSIPVLLSSFSAASSFLRPAASPARRPFVVNSVSLVVIVFSKDVVSDNCKRFTSCRKRRSDNFIAARFLLNYTQCKSFVERNSFILDMFFQKDVYWLCHV